MKDKKYRNECHINKTFCFWNTFLNSVKKGDLIETEGDVENAEPSLHLIWCIIKFSFLYHALQNTYPSYSILDGTEKKVNL